MGVLQHWAHRHSGHVMAHHSMQHRGQGIISSSSCSTSTSAFCTSIWGVLAFCLVLVVPPKKLKSTKIRGTSTSSTSDTITSTSAYYSVPVLLWCAYDEPVLMYCSTAHMTRT